MVVLSAAVCSQKGKVLVSRQFVSMTRLRIEGLLSAFPKLLDNEGNDDTKKQHTFVETDEVRYVYQPMDDIYVLLVTNKTSNIIKDLKTLRLLAKLVPEYCQGYEEEAVVEHSFELIFAFDEVVSLGYAEDVDIGKIRTYTTMDSHEEKLTKIIQESKKNEAKEHAKKRAREIAEEKKKMGSHQAFSSSSYGGDYNSGGTSGGGFGSYGGSATNEYNNNAHEESPEPVSPKKKKKKTQKKGFSLKRGKNKKKGMFDDMIADEESKMGPSLNAMIKNTAVEEETNYENPEPVKIKLEEKCSIICERDGALKKFDVAGSLTLTITDPDCSKVKIEYTTNGEKDIQYRAFPKIDKTQFKKNILALKDSSQGFPVGGNSKQAILKWKLRSTDEKYLPLTINFWPSEESDSTVITVDYNAENLENITLQNVMLTIPGIEDKPEVNEITGDSNYLRNDNEFQWFIGTVESGDSGNLEIVCPELEDEDQYYPLQITFTSEQLYSGLEITKVINENDEEVEFFVKNDLFVNKFHVEA